MNLTQTVREGVDKVKTYWKTPMAGRYMTFKEIAAYAGGGIGAYFLIYMGGQLAVNINNMIVGGAIGLSPTHMYILYVIATLANIPYETACEEFFKSMLGRKPGEEYRESYVVETLKRLGFDPDAPIE